MSVRRCQQEIDAREFEEWLLYSQLGPWDASRADWRAGIVAATLANVHRGKHTRAFTPGDFLPQWDAPQKPRRTRKQTPEEIRHIFTLFTLASGGTVPPPRPAPQE